MKLPKVSVIVPIYNVENYVIKCLETLNNQTYNNIEVICIDDCSTDNSYNVVKKYISNKDNFILIKNKVNSGLSFTRNTGIEKSSGDYISFIDSDDYVDLNFYEKLVNKIIKDKSDVAVCDINIVYESEGKIIKNKCGDIGNKKINFVNNGLAASACNKLFKKELFINEKFEIGKVNEDIAVIIPLLVNANKVSYVEECCYYYIQRTGSIQNSSISFKRFDIFCGVDLAIEKIKKQKNFLKFKEALIFQQIFMLFIYVLPKEKSIIKRSKLLKCFYKLSKKYHIRKNIFVWQFLDSQTTKVKYYYKLLLKLNDNGFSFLTSLIISFYDFYKHISYKSIIKKNIEMQHLINLAKKQQNKKSNDIKLTVVIPNYNYEKYLKERIYSILNQKEKIYEILILDDCSSDNSRKLIDEIYNNLKKYINIKKVYNSKNSGSAFKQWEKGFDLAQGNYVWIAEADDYCDKKFLQKVLKPIKKDDEIYISYSDTAFIDARGNIFLKTIKPEIDVMRTGHWSKSYINSGSDEFNNYTYVNCTIANVSSAIIKNDNYKKYFKISGKYKQAGDWLFYANVMQKGKIAYYNKPLNYYRVHGNNVSSVTKKEAHIKEINQIHNFFDNTYGLNRYQKNQIKKRISFLEKVWNLKPKKNLKKKKKTT